MPSNACAAEATSASVASSCSRQNLASQRSAARSKRCGFSLADRYAHGEGVSEIDAGQLSRGGADDVEVAGLEGRRKRLYGDPWLGHVEHTFAWAARLSVTRRPGDVDAHSRSVATCPAGGRQVGTVGRWTPSGYFNDWQTARRRSSGSRHPQRRANVRAPTARPRYSWGDEQGVHGPASSRHSNVDSASVEENEKLADVDGLLVGGFAVIAVSGGAVSGGGVVSTIHVNATGVASTLPTVSTARTSKACSPSASPLISSGEEQGAHALSSRTRRLSRAPSIRT
jgi:hypothetical protein